MTNLLSKNAYGILGLSSSSTQKELTKRVKEIEKYLKIDETPNYSFDLGIYNVLRSLQNIKQAMQDITNPQSQILHYFFSLYITTEKEKNFIEDLSKEFQEEKIINFYENSSSKSFNLKKNTAILLTLTLINKNVVDFHKISLFSIELWKEIFENNKNWKDFEKIYLLDDELGINQDLFNTIKDASTKELINIYSNIAEIYGDNTILAYFLKSFNLQNSLASIKQVDEIYKKLDKIINDLKSMDISGDGIFDNNEKKLLSGYLKAIQDEFNKLIDLNLYENSRTIILRDKTAEIVRIQLLDLHNNLDEKETSLKLLDIAINICGTQSLRIKLKADKDTIQTNVILDQKFATIDKTIEKLNSQILHCSKSELNKHIENIKNDLILIETSCNLTEEQLIYLKDTSVFKIRDIAIKISNENKKYEQAKLLLITCKNICGSNKVFDLSNKDLITIQNNINNKPSFLQNYSGCLGYVIFYGAIALIANGLWWVIPIIIIGFIIWNYFKK